MSLFLSVCKIIVSTHVSYKNVIIQNTGVLDIFPVAILNRAILSVLDAVCPAGHV